MIKERNKVQRKFAKRPITYGEAHGKLENRISRSIKSSRAQYFRQISLIIKKFTGSLFHYQHSTT